MGPHLRDGVTVSEPKEKPVSVPVCETCKKSLLKCKCDNDLAKKVETDLEK